MLVSLSISLNHCTGLEHKAFASLLAAAEVE